jgi:Tfp pilus assembly protein PilF
VRFADSVGDRAQPLRLAEKAVAGSPKDAYVMNTLGAALYRAGRFQDCIDKLRETMALQGKGGIAADWLFLSLAHQRLGQQDKAKKWLKKAVSWLDQNQQSLPWNSRLEYQLLRREAEALLKENNPQGAWAGGMAQEKNSRLRSGINCKRLSFLTCTGRADQ